MLTVRNGQLGMFVSERRQALENRLLRALAQNYPKDYSALGNDGSVMFVRETVNSAISRNIGSEAAIHGLMRLYIEFGPNLELSLDREWAAGMLDNGSLPDILRVNLVSQRLFGWTQGQRLILHREEE